MTPTRACRARMRSSVAEGGTVILDRRSERRNALAVKGRVGHAGEIGIDHHLDEAGEVDRGLPAQLLARLAVVADEMLHFGWTDELGIQLDVLVPIQPDVRERRFDQLADGVA